ncbi:MAG: hypothetical protein ACR2NP_05330 [Pirellulaceae bacterium]
MRSLALVSVSLFSLCAIPRCCPAWQDQDDQTDVATVQPVETTSLSGQPLRRRAFSEERLEKLEGDLQAAIEESNSAGRDVHSLIWVARRLGYLWRYQEAIQTLDVAAANWPDSPHVYRHRGHRFITTRQFDRAVADLQRAANLIEGTEDEVEQDGAHNAKSIPTSTLHTNIYYHLGLAHYLRGEYQQALGAYELCLAASKNNDMKVATLDWMVMTLRRLDRHDDAMKLLEDITADMEIIENTAYHRRLLMYKGELSPDDLIPGEDSEDRALDLATYGYGVGNWYLANGDEAKAREIFEEVTAGEYWAAFGFIAAEADLIRMGQ